MTGTSFFTIRDFFLLHLFSLWFVADSFLKDCGSALGLLGGYRQSLNAFRGDPKAAQSLA